MAKRQYVESGDRFAAGGQLSEAAIEYRNALQQDARFGEARLKLGEVLLKQGNAAAALREFARAADLLPSDATAQVRAGTMHLLAEQFEDAARLADRALAVDPGHVEAQVLKGNALAGLKNLDGAIAQLESAISADPTRGLSYANLGALEQARGQRQDAERAYVRALEIEPGSVVARTALANFYLANGQQDRAEQLLKEGLAISPDDLPLHRMLASLYVSSGRSAEAEPHLRAAAEASGDPAAQLELADYYRTFRRLEDALGILTRLEAVPAVAGTARARKASLLYGEGRTREAHQLVDVALEREPQHVELLLAKGEMLATEGDLTGALRLAQNAATVDPSSAAAHFLVARIQNARGSRNEAIVAFNEVLARRPRFTVAQLQLAHLHLAARRPNEALAFAGEALSLEPDNPEARLLQGRALLALGDTTGAEPVLTRLAAEFPNVAAVHVQLAGLHMARRNTRAARAAYERALAIEPSSLEALRGVVALDLDANDRAAAYKRLDGALTTRPDSPAVLLLAAHTRVRGGDRDEAEGLLRRAIALDAGALEAYALLGDVYRSQGRLDEAAREYEKLAALNPTYAGIQTTLGTIFQEQRKYDEARAHYEKALSLEPNAPVAANNLAWIYAEQGGNLDVALQLAQTARAALPDAAGVAHTLGWVQYKRGLFGSAVASLEEAATREPRNATYHYHLGLAYARNGNERQARQALQQALTIDPGAGVAADARAELDRLAAPGR